MIHRSKRQARKQAIEKLKADYSMQASDKTKQAMEQFFKADDYVPKFPWEMRI